MEIDLRHGIPPTEALAANLPIICLEHGPQGQQLPMPGNAQVKRLEPTGIETLN